MYNTWREIFPWCSCGESGVWQDKWKGEMMRFIVLTVIIYVYNVMYRQTAL